MKNISRMASAPARVIPRPALKEADWPAGRYAGTDWSGKGPGNGGRPAGDAPRGASGTAADAGTPSPAVVR